MAHYVLTYQTSAEYLQRRGDFRAAHLALAWQYVEQGHLLLGGALGEPVQNAMLLFQCDDPAIIEQFAKADPYVINGLVSQYHIQPWHTVVGEHAAQPLKLA